MGPSTEEPVLKQIDMFLSRSGADALSGVSGSMQASPLHDANVCNLTMAYLTVRGNVLCAQALIYMPCTEHGRNFLFFPTTDCGAAQVVLGCILPIHLNFYFERMLRIQYAKRVLTARGRSAEAGGLVDDQCYAFMTGLGLAIGLTVALWQAVEFLDFLFPDGVFPSDFLEF